ncbi:hypothetical protein BDR26DRAFT_431712 [Obelidium mucronatum]|nr:hypothetical protein BDR26DRAFT_431712 [Obelidium mucronatum]
MEIPTTYPVSQSDVYLRTPSKASAAAGKSSAKRYMCKTPGCGKDFSTSGHLSRHSRIHYGVKRYSCDVDGCDRTFFRADNALQHQKSHRKRLAMEASMVPSGGFQSSFVLIPASPEEPTIMSAPSMPYPPRMDSSFASEKSVQLPCEIPQSPPVSPDFTLRVHELCEAPILQQTTKTSISFLVD